MTSSIPVGDVETSVMIESIIADTSIKESEILDKINSSKIMKEHKRNSFLVIFNVSNTMMGTALLVMPINFYLVGLVSSVISSIIVALVSFITANIVIKHSREDEIDFPEAIQRILGIKWAKLFNALSMFFLFLVGIIHFVLMAQTFFAILKNVFQETQNWSNGSEIIFSHFSIQWVGVIMFILCTLLYSVKNMKYILKISDVGIYMILIYSIFLLYLGVSCFIKYDLSFTLNGQPGMNKDGLEIILFTGDIFNIVGIFATAYFIHSVCCGLMKNSQNPDKNTRNLGISYIIVMVLYNILGIFGTFAVACMYNAMVINGKIEIGKVPSTVIELLVKDNPMLTKMQIIMSVISLFLIFIQLTTVSSILCLFTRRQFFDLFYGPRKRLSIVQYHSFNLVYNLGCLLVEILSVPIGTLIGFTGAVAGFFLVYVIPIFVHLKCLYLKKDNNQNLIEEFKLSNRCVDHYKEHLGNKYIVFIFYGFIFLIGAAILVAQLYDLLKNILIKYI